MEHLTPLPTTDPAALTLPELVRLYEDLAPKGGSPYKTRVEVELASRLRPGKGFVDGTVYRFCVDQAGDLVKVRLLDRQGVWLRHKKPAINGRPPEPAGARAVKRSGGIAAHKLYNAEDDGY